MIKLSSSIKLAGIAVATVLLAGGGVALAASVVPAASTSPASSHSPDADDSTSAQGKQGQQGQHGKSEDECDGKAAASAMPSARPTVHESEKPDVDSSAEPATAKDSDDADDQCGNGQHGNTCDTDATKSHAPHPSTTAGRSHEQDETGCQTGQHGQTERPDTDHSNGQTAGDGQQETSPHPTLTSSWHGDR